MAELPDLLDFEESELIIMAAEMEDDVHLSQAEIEEDIQLSQVATEIEDDIKLAVCSQEIEADYFDDLAISQAANMSI